MGDLPYGTPFNASEQEADFGKSEANNPRQKNSEETKEVCLIYRQIKRRE